MKKILLVTFLILNGIAVYSQINMADSTVQVVTWWDIGNKANYSVHIENIRINDSDTTSHKIVTYDVAVTVMNMTDDSYEVMWNYTNVMTNDPDTSAQELMKINENVNVIFRTNELGLLLEVINWREIRDLVYKAGETLRNKLSETPEVKQTLDHIFAAYATKEAIESVSIKDIRQFHLFHGSMYHMDKVIEGRLAVPNIYGSGPLMADYTVSVDEVDNEEGNYTLRFLQIIDHKQLNDATFKHLQSLAESMNIDPPTREQVPEMSNETEIISTITETGWVISSSQTRILTSENDIAIEKQVIRRRM